MICLYECWLDSNDVSIPNYECCSIHREHGRGGGIAIFIRDSIKQYCYVTEKVCDSIAIIKIEGNAVGGNKDLYIFVNYIPPSNSAYYEINDVDLFTVLEDKLGIYANMGDTIAIGDFNGRTGTQDDFIVNDRLAESTVNILNDVCDYLPDENIICRKSEDKTVNHFGRKLISLCKTTGLRIVNGRHHGDSSGNITFYNANGISLIDYLLVSENNFDLILHFNSGNFNSFSDHAPICFKFSYPVSDCNEGNNEISDNHKSRIQWNDDNNVDIAHAVGEHLDDLLNICCINEYSIDSINTAVDTFTRALNEIVLPYCSVIRSSTRPRGNFHRRKKDDDKPWFNQLCKQRFLEYKNALHAFNYNKTNDNRAELVRLKKTYKKLESKLKREYKCQKGNMLNYLRRYNPNFFSNISKDGNEIKNPL